MAHELSFSLDGKAEMAYAGSVPWHGLGQKVSQNASLDIWLQEARMEWEIKKAPVQFMNGELHNFDQHLVLYRSDNNQPLSVVSDRYKVVQPREMLGFFRNLVESQGFQIETIGSLKGGRRIWALAKTPFTGEVGKGDKLSGYLLLVTSCDGTLATTAKFTSIRVVCWNTQHIALGERSKGGEVRVRHSTEFNPLSVQSDLGLLGVNAFDSFMEKMKGLTKVKMTQNDATSIITSLLPTPMGEKDITQSAGFIKVMGLFNGGAMGSHLPGTQNTAWGLLNAITEFTDHHARSRSIENRLSSQWFGRYADLKSNAESMLCELIA